MTERELNKLKKFYGTHRQSLYSHAYFLTGNPEMAEDAVQAAMARVVATGRLPTRIKAYMYKCVRAVIIDAWRKNRHMKEQALNEGDLWHPQEDVPLIMDLRNCLFKLKPEIREIILLKINGGMTFAEIAEISNENLSTVVMRYRRGLQRMRGLMNECR